MNLAALSEKQQIFVKQYAGLLQEVEEAAQYVGECYIQGDEDIGDRLLASVSTGLIPYNPENMTLLSIFSQDQPAMDKLAQFYEAILTAAKMTETEAAEGDRMRFLHENFIPKLHQWKLTVNQYIEIGGDGHATH